MQLLQKNCFRLLSQFVIPSILLVALSGTAAFAQDFYNGFEVDTAGWDVFTPPLNATRVSDGTNGIASATGDYHATGSTPATRWGGSSSVFPAGGYMTSVDIFLDVDAGFANDTRLDFSSAISNTAGGHRRDFIFNLGFYNDGTGPGAGDDRFVVSASNNSSPGSAFPKNLAKFPIVIGVTGWYSFVHEFRNNGGVLEVEMSILDEDEDLVGNWLLSDPTDLIGLTVGGNRYGWFDYNQFGEAFAFDNTLKLSDSDGDGVTDGEDHCPNSDFRPFVDVGSGPTSIDNEGSGVDDFGCTIQDLVNECEDTAKNHGDYVSCITQLANDLYKDGVITKNQRQEMKTGAAKSSIGK